jgi:hypothetical protein
VTSCSRKEWKSYVAHQMLRHATVIYPSSSSTLQPAGACSRALLHCLVALRNPSSTRLQRGVVAFELHVVHVEEGGAWGQPQQETAAASDAVRASAQHGSEGHTIGLHTTGLEDAFCDDACGMEPNGIGQRRQQLVDLLQARSR